MGDAAVIVVDVEGRITAWNDDAVSLLGWTTDEAIGRSVELVVPPEHRKTHWAGFRRAMADPQIKDMAADLPVLCADGRVKPFAGRLLALSDGLGTAVGAVAVYAPTGTTGVRPFG